MLAGALIEGPAPAREYRISIASRNQNSSARVRRDPDETWKVRWIP